MPGFAGKAATVFWEYATEALPALYSKFGVYLGDGITRVQTGERLQNITRVDASRSWDAVTLSLRGLRTNHADRPDYPPSLAPDRHWFFLGSCDDTLTYDVERRGIMTSRDTNNLEDSIVVFQDGVALPTTELLRIVNTAYAATVVGLDKRYYYLHDGFVLSTRQENALVEWGVGRPVFANSILAVGGTVLVWFAEVWRPAIGGTLLVAAAEVGFRGAVTKVWRVESRAWKSHYMLVPSGVFGLERAMQGVLAALLAYAGLVGSRGLLLATLTIASVRVVLLEFVCHAQLTWGSWRSIRTPCVQQVGLLASSCLGLAGWLWLTYAFAGFFCCAAFGGSAACTVWGFQDRGLGKAIGWALLLVSVGVGICAAVMGWDDADLILSPQSLQPWKWPLRRAPASFWAGLRVVGLWLGMVVGFVVAVYIVVELFTFKIGSDGGKKVGSGKRTRARNRRNADGITPGFTHYYEEPIPSRHLIDRDVGPPA